MPVDEPEPTATRTPFERLGGRPGIEPIISDFIDRVISDMMIGFFFKKVPIDRLKQLELEFACAHLGGPLGYTGRPLENAHGPHRIMGGQFNRRLRILEQTLRDHTVPQDIAEHWISHNEAQRQRVTLDGPFACNGALPQPPAQSPQPETQPAHPEARTEPKTPR